jgi:hypothetical protein
MKCGNSTIQLYIHLVATHLFCCVTPAINIFLFLMCTVYIFY